MTDKRIKVGIAGLGRSGWNIHAHLLSLLPGRFEIVAVLDADDERRKEAKAKFACQTYSEGEFEQLVENQNVELVVNALPSFLHASLSIQTLEADKHVVCEKPMATSLADADRMVEAYRKSGKILTIFQQRRYQNDFLKVKEIIESGVLGRIVQIRMSANGFSRRWDWQTLQKYGGGSLNNTGPHLLDQALQLFGAGYPEVIYSRLERTLTLGDADDHVKIVFSSYGKPTIDIEISSASAYPTPAWMVMGTDGGLTGSARRLEWRSANWEAMPERALTEEPTPDRSYNRDAPVWNEHAWEQEGSAEEAHLNYYRDLYETIRNGGPLVITPQQIRRVIWLQAEAHRLSPLDE